MIIRGWSQTLDQFRNQYSSAGVEQLDLDAFSTVLRAKGDKGECWLVVDEANFIGVPEFERQLSQEEMTVLQQLLG